MLLRITPIFLIFFALQLAMGQGSNPENHCDTAVAFGEGIFTIDRIPDDSDSPPDCSQQFPEPASGGFWFTLTSEGDGTASVSSNLPQNRGRDTRLHVYTGTCEELTCITGNDDVDAANENYLSEVTFEIQEGVKYYIAFDNNYESEGFDVEITATATLLNTPHIQKLPVLEYYVTPHGSLHVESTSEIEGISIYDLTGKKLMQRKIESNRARLELALLPKGIYIVEALSELGRESFKILKR